MLAVVKSSMADGSKGAHDKPINFSMLKQFCLFQLIPTDSTIFITDMQFLLTIQHTLAFKGSSGALFYCLNNEKISHKVKGRRRYKLFYVPKSKSPNGPNCHISTIEITMDIAICTINTLLSASFYAQYSLRVCYSLAVIYHTIEQ